MAEGAVESKNDDIVVTALDEEELKARQAFVPRAGKGTEGGSDFVKNFLGVYETGAVVPELKLLEALPLDYGTASLPGTIRVRGVEHANSTRLSVV